MSNLKLDSTLKLINVAAGAAPTWERSEFGAILSHFLRAGVRETGSSLDPVLREQCQRVLPVDGPDTAFERMLQPDPAPPLPLLRLIKQIANACLQRSELGVPRSVAEVLYYLSFAAAYVHHHCWITSLKLDDALDGLGQIVDYDWVDARGRAMLAQCLDLIHSGEG